MRNLVKALVRIKIQINYNLVLMCPNISTSTPKKKPTSHTSYRNLMWQVIIGYTEDPGNSNTGQDPNRILLLSRTQNKGLQFNSQKIRKRSARFHGCCSCILNYQPFFKFSCLSVSFSFIKPSCNLKDINSFSFINKRCRPSHGAQAPLTSIC